MRVIVPVWVCPNEPVELYELLIEPETVNAFPGVSPKAVPIPNLIVSVPAEPVVTNI